MPTQDDFVYFATNRDSADGSFGERFHEDGPMFFRVGMAKVVYASAHPDEGYEIKGVEIFEESPGGPEETKKAILGSKRLFRDLRRMIRTSRKDVVVLVHGFACSFTDSLKRAGQVRDQYLVRKSAGDGVEEVADGQEYKPYVVVFSWPSNGRVLPPWEYHSDRDDAEASGKAIARFMMRLFDFLKDDAGQCQQRLHLVVHSMGNWALRHALTGARSLNGEGRLPTVFANAFLVAPDEDDDALGHEEKLGLLTQLARDVHVYHSTDDLALMVSNTTKMNPNRLGTGGPKSFSGLSSQIVAIDCSAVDETDPLHGRHQYYRLRGEVIGDVRAVLSREYKPDQVPGRVTVEPARRFRIRR